jgi:hypothetical protein
MLYANKCHGWRMTIGIEGERRRMGEEGLIQDESETGFQATDWRHIYRRMTLLRSCAGAETHRRDGQSTGAM